MIPAPPPPTYEKVSLDDHHASRLAAYQTFRNFVLMSLLFGANHGCVAACLSLATSRLGSTTGAWQSGILYLTYTLSSIVGATWIVKKFGSRDGLILGMALYCTYVGCFWLATHFNQDNDLELEMLVIYVGAAVGGIGAGLLWTSQGSYFSKAAEDHAGLLQQPLYVSTSCFAGIFGFLYLFEEAMLRLLSTVVKNYFPREYIFAFYTTIAVTATLAMPLVVRYPMGDYEDDDENNDPTRSTIFYQVTAAIQLLWRDPKMKYMIGLNSVFGFTSAYLNSYVNGEVIPVALHDPNGKLVGTFSAWSSATAAIMSMAFARIGSRTSPYRWGGNGTFLIFGTICFVIVVSPFIIQPVASEYSWTILVMIYTSHGFGRGIFESTLKATFANYFPYEKEGAFANIIIQNGLASAFGYVCTWFCLLLVG